MKTTWPNAETLEGFFSVRAWLSLSDFNKAIRASGFSSVTAKRIREEGLYTRTIYEGSGAIKVTRVAQTPMDLVDHGQGWTVEQANKCCDK